MRGDRTTGNTRDDLDHLLCQLDAQDDTTVTVSIESRRYGKTVTVIDGLDGRPDANEVLRVLKQGLATGGSAKDGRIELQGDHRRRAAPILAERGIAVAP